MYNSVDVTAIQVIQAKILHLLTIYPKISYPMLQVGIGPSVNPAIWRPVLQDLMDKRLIQEEERSLRGPTGRQNAYRILSLTLDGLAYTKGITDPPETAVLEQTEHTQGRPS